MPDISSVVVAPEPAPLNLRERLGWLRVMPHLRRGNRIVRKLRRANGTERVALLAALRVWQGEFLQRAGVDIEVHGAPLQSPALFVSNHVSWIDPLIFGSVLPARFLAKSEVGRWPVVGTWVNAIGTLFIDRGQHQTGAINDSMAEIMRNGGQAAIFPEGTTSIGDRVGYFFPRLMGAAQAAGVPVQPVALRYVEPERPRPVIPFVDADPFFPHAQRMLSNRGNRAELTFLEPIDSKGRDRRSLASEARLKISEALQLPAAARQEDDFDRAELFARLRSLF